MVEFCKLTQGGREEAEIKLGKICKARLVSKDRYSIQEDAVTKMGGQVLGLCRGPERETTGWKQVVRG